MFFFLLALGTYRWYARKPQISRYLLVCNPLDGLINNGAGSGGMLLPFLAHPIGVH